MPLGAIDSYAGGAYPTCCLATGARPTFLVVDDDNNTATVAGDTSQAIAIGTDNKATVTGNDSNAFAGPGGSNTATVTGDGLTADTGGGSGNTVTCPGDPTCVTAATP